MENTALPKVRLIFKMAPIILIGIFFASALLWTVSDFLELSFILLGVVMPASLMAACLSYILCSSQKKFVSNIAVILAKYPYIRMDREQFKTLFTKNPSRFHLCPYEVNYEVNDEVNAPDMLSLAAYSLDSEVSEPYVIAFPTPFNYMMAVNAIEKHTEKVVAAYQAELSRNSLIENDKTSLLK